MKLYHFTDNKIKDKIKPSYFGENRYTLRDIQSSKVKRSFFFTVQTPQEFRFKNCKYQYTAYINDNKIYNLIQDNKKLIKRGKSIHYILQKIKKLGYSGALYNISYNVVILFNDIDISKTKGR